MNTIAQITLIAFTTVWTSMVSANNNLSDPMRLAIREPTHQNDTSDAGITTKIKSLIISEKLFGSADVSAITIKVETNKGVVTLSGNAENQLQIDNAAKISKSVAGVNNVINNVTIKN